MEKSGTSDWIAEYDAILSKEGGAKYDGKQVLRVTYNEITYAGAKKIF
jgi:hypothetical protein